MGDHSWLDDGVNCYSVAAVKLGPNAVVSQLSSLCITTHNYSDPSFPLVTMPIVIESGAWVGALKLIGCSFIIHPLLSKTTNGIPAAVATVTAQSARATTSWFATIEVI